MAQHFDERELLERIDGDVTFLADTLQMLEMDGQSMMAQVKTELVAGDGPAAGRTAHTLKGMISNFCAPAVHEMALEVEKAAKAGDCPTATAAANRLETALEALVGELGEFVKART